MIGESYKIKLGVGFFFLIAPALYATNYGSFYKSEFLLRFRALTGERSQLIVELLLMLESIEFTSSRPILSDTGIIFSE
jgi:hypothetical protein